MIENILVAVDGSAHAHAAVDMAGEIAAKFGARVTLLHVMTELGSARVPDELRWYAEAEKIRLSEADILRSVANEIVQRAERRARERGAERIETAIELGDPAGTIVGHAKAHKTDLIVMGRRGLGDIRGLLLGSVSHKVGHLAGCACLTVM